MREKIFFVGNLKNLQKFLTIFGRRRLDKIKKEKKEEEKAEMKYYYCFVFFFFFVIVLELS